jgi:hypothetical protein
MTNVFTNTIHPITSLSFGKKKEKPKKINIAHYRLMVRDIFLSAPNRCIFIGSTGHDRIKVR